MPLTLTWNCPDTWPVDASSLSPDTFAGASAVEAASRVVRFGNADAALGELFRLDGSADDGELRLAGELGHLRGLGTGMASGRLIVDGSVGDYVGVGMSGGEIEIRGSAGVWAGAEMKGGRLTIRGDAGDRLGAALPGSRVGMRDGLILVDGSVGREAGASMRRGLIAIGGRSGEALGLGLVAGSIFVVGEVAPLVGLGMKRGSIVCFHERVPVPASFEPSGTFRPRTLPLYFKHLDALGFKLPSDVSSRGFLRYNGDLSGRGQGEILASRS